MTSNISIVCANWASSLGLKVLAMRILFCPSRHSDRRIISAVRRSACSKLAASFERSRQYGEFPLCRRRFVLITRHLCPILARAGRAKRYVVEANIAVGVAGSDEGGSADAKADASGKVKAAAAGISSGSGDNVIVNVAPLIVRASSTAGAGSVAVSTGGDVEGNVRRRPLPRPPASVAAAAATKSSIRGRWPSRPSRLPWPEALPEWGVKGEDSDDQEKPPAPPKLETSRR